MDGASTAVVQASPIEYDPYTPVNTSIPLSPSHPAYGGPMKNCVEPIIPADPNAPKAQAMKLQGPVYLDPLNCIEPIIPADPNAPKAQAMKLQGPVYRKLHAMETSDNSDIEDLETFFGSKMEVNIRTLRSQYTSGSAPTTPWASSYWSTFQDGINRVWKAGEPSPSEKYAVADGLNSSTPCTADADCTNRKDGSVCAKRDGSTAGYCIPTWFGICHAWAPAAILEPEPQCDVTKNGVTFRVFDIKALVTTLYGGASIRTVFTGARFNGPDTPATKDQYGRFTNAARRDMGAGFFHIAIANIMGKQKRSFVVDVTAGAEVWNQPVRSFVVRNMDLVNTRTASMKYFGIPTYPFNDKMVRLAYAKTTFSWIVESYVDGPLVSTGQVDRYTVARDYEYLLELDVNYNIIGGEWVGNSKDDHPDFLWFPTAKPAANVVTGVGLSYANIQELVQQSLSCSA
ncbi:hypothetical protein PHYSODRAFT_246587 [Phytophthora sojae]|uniref:Uncharacterized protein n=1 Tax=Phytophthora sojae (strain P6497) TaxID=1094619 RepID=G5ADR6_PHYSP|nr:hypothetical protein PHYSODRAFT_246587 [Phytophthora sojae]EGZ06319.1 hypothetical protein PHYSODRAFT_246587 [Phytophthora sojae]|eukprot:XP_009538216.1 hypothetical protein PHYSODRAFT_246587 [Phytophthora sojae]